MNKIKRILFKKKKYTRFDTEFDGSAQRVVGHFRFDGGHLRFWYMTPLRVETSTYIPNSKVLPQRVIEIWATSSVTAAICIWVYDPYMGRTYHLHTKFEGPSSKV